MKRLIALALTLCTAATVAADVDRRKIKYESSDGTELTGVLYFDADAKEPRPAVLVVHEWWGRNDYAERRARMLAELGYTAFALDMYGVDEPATDPAGASALAAPFRTNPELFRIRGRAGLLAMLDQPEADAENVAVIGYCFGGTTALEVAYSSPEIDVAVCFHGNLTLPTAMEAARTNATIVVCNGAADPFIPMEDRTRFVQTMNERGIDYMFVEYAGALHAFTNPAADEVAEAGLAGVGYDGRADKRSWSLMLQTFRERLGM